MIRLKASGIRLAYGSVDVLKGIDLELRDGSVLVLLGSSGCGKTTLLRCLAGLEQPKAGRITVGDRTLFDAEAGVEVPTERRNMGIVFQSYALWPHRTISENVGYGLKLRRVATSEINARTDEVLTDLGLRDLAKRYPHQISGGQQQRVAIARAIVYGPSLLLLDEPLSNLDAQMREDAKAWLKRTIKRFGLSAIMVTHDQSEAMALGDEVVLMGGGTILQRGTPEEIYNRPASEEVARFFGSNNIMPGSLQRLATGRPGFAFAGKVLPATVIAGTTLDDARLPDGTPCTAVARVESFETADKDGAPGLDGTIVWSMYMGSYWEHALQLADDTVVRFRSSKALRHTGQRLTVSAESLWLFPTNA